MISKGEELMRLRLKVLAGSLVTAGAVALIPIVTAGSGEAPKPAATPSIEAGPPPNENTRPDPLPPAPSVVALPESTRGAIDASVSARPEMKALLSKASYVIFQHGPWTRADGRERIGTVVELRLSKPVDTPMQKWSVMTWLEASNTYATNQLNAQYAGVKELVVHLDTELRVVSVMPKGARSITLGAGNQWMQQYVGTQGDR
jgi:hypothetical protein